MENSQGQMPSNAATGEAVRLVSLTTATEQEKVACEIEKLKAEAESLRSSNRWEKRVTRYVPIITVLVAVASFWFGVYQFRRQQRTELEKFTTQQNAEIERLRGQFDYSIKLSEKEFRRLFYEKQLEVYFDVSKTVAQISTVADPREVDQLHAHFLEL